MVHWMVHCVANCVANCVALQYFCTHDTLPYNMVPTTHMVTMRREEGTMRCEEGTMRCEE